MSQDVSSLKCIVLKKEIILQLEICCVLFDIVGFQYARLMMTEWLSIRAEELLCVEIQIIGAVIRVKPRVERFITRFKECGRNVGGTKGIV